MSTEPPHTKRTIIIETDEGTKMILPAPGDKFFARQFWVFLVENLQPGFTVILQSGPAELTRRSSTNVTIDLYRSLMEMEEA